MYDLVAPFAGERAADTTQTNFVFPDPPLLGAKLVRGVVPFMVVPSAGHYLMLSLLGGRVACDTCPHSDGPGPRAIGWAAVVVIAAALLTTYSRQSLLGAAVGLVVMLGWHRRRPCCSRGRTRSTRGGGTAAGSRPHLVGYLIEGTEASTQGVVFGTSQPAPRRSTPTCSSPGGRYRAGSVQYPQPGPEVYYAHNLLLDSAVEVGIVGAAALVLLFSGALDGRAHFERSWPAAARSYLVANLFDDTFYSAQWVPARGPCSPWRVPGNPADDHPVAEGTPTPAAGAWRAVVPTTRAGGAPTAAGSAIPRLTNAFILRVWLSR